MTPVCVEVGMVWEQPYSRDMVEDQHGACGSLSGRRGDSLAQRDRSVLLMQLKSPSSTSCAKDEQLI